MKVSQFGISILTLGLLITVESPAQLIEEKTEAEEAVESIMNEGTAPAEALKKFGQMVEEKGAILSERARKEIDKYRIRLTIDPLGNIFDSEDTSGGTYYQIVVEPAFRNREQLRRDVWSIDLSVGFGDYFSAGTTARVTFSRYFSGPNAKLDAITAPVLCPVNLIVCKRKMPLNSNEVKTLLKSGEGFRLEILGDIGIGISDALTLGSAAIRGKRAGMFLMDIYKFSDNLIRTRFVGIKNSGELELGVGLRKQAGSFFGSNIGFIRRNISIGFNLGARRSFDFKDWEPKTLDTMMLDYLFNFSESRELTKEELTNKEISEHAFDEIFRNIRRGGILPLFLTFEKGEKITKKLLAKAERAESQSQEDQKLFREGKIKFQQMRVVNYFKGRLESFVQNFEIGARLLDLVGGNSLTGTISSYVISYDSQQKPNFYFLENSFTRHNSRSMFGRNKYNLQYDVDILLLSDKDQNVGPISDVVIKNDIEDTRMSESSVETYKKIINNSLPNIYRNNKEVLDVVGTGAKTNTSLIYKTSFGDRAWTEVGELDAEQVRLKLVKYFEEHPERSFMHLPCDQTGDNTVISLNEYTNEKAYDIVRIFDPKATRQQRLEALRIASRDPVFDRYLIGEFFGHLISDSAPEDVYSFEVRSSNFESGTKSAQLGKNKISPIYEAVSFVRSIINNQSIDLQMTNTVDGQGNGIITPVNGSALTIPAVIE
jgi:hypothetical protein